MRVAIAYPIRDVAGRGAAGDGITFDDFWVIIFGRSGEGSVGKA